MTHKVAILLTTESYNDYSDDYHQVLSSISEWEEISNEDFVVLQSASWRKGFKILEQPADPKQFIARTVSEEIARAKDEELKLEAEKIKRAEKARLRKYQTDLKDKDTKLALLKKLQAELGPDAQ